MKKLWILTLCLFAILSVDAAAQLTSLSQLPDQKQAITMGYAYYAGANYARFDVEYSFTDRTKLALINDLGFFTSADNFRLRFNSYYQVVHLEPLSTALDYFFVGALGLGGEFVSGHIGNASRRATFDDTFDFISVGGGGGFLLKTMGSFKPFAGVTYNRYFTVSEDAISFGGLFSILLGFDFDISSRIGAVGQVVLDYEPGFGFYDGGIFFIGLRLH